MTGFRVVGTLLATGYSASPERFKWDTIMATTRTRLAISLLFLTVASVSNAGAINKWTDANGKVHYGDRAPANVSATQVKIRPAAPAAAGEVKDVSPQAQLARLLKSNEPDEGSVQIVADADSEALKCGQDDGSTCVSLVVKVPAQP